MTRHSKPTSELLHFDIGLELEVVDADIDEDELRRVIESALRHSTASEALTEAVTQYDDRVLFLGWWLKAAEGVLP